MKTYWAKFQVWIMNVRINFLMNKMLLWMLEASHAKLFIDTPGNLERHAMAESKYIKFKNKFQSLVDIRNQYAEKHRVKAHPNAPESLI